MAAWRRLAISNSPVGSSKNAKRHSGAKKAASRWRINPASIGRMSISSGERGRMFTLNGASFAALVEIIGHGCETGKKIGTVRAAASD